jgi:hypothetical protein
MTKQSQGSGHVVDELIQNPRRLGIAHSCMGLASAFVYWIRPGTFTPHRPYIFTDVTPIILTFIAWVPYVVGFFISSSVLAGRNPNAVLAYIVLAAAITVTATGYYLNIFALHEVSSPIAISGGVALALIAGTAICAAVWRIHLSNDK